MQDYQQLGFLHTSTEEVKLLPTEVSQTQTNSGSFRKPEYPSELPARDSVKESTVLGKRLAKQSGLETHENKDLDEEGTTNISLTKSKRMKVIQPTHTPGALSCDNKVEALNFQAIQHDRGVERKPESLDLQ